MRHAILLAALGASFLVACGLLKKKEEDAGVEAGAVVEVDAAPPPPAAAPEPTAANAAKIARYGNDPKLDGSKEKLQADLTIAREAPHAGVAVAFLKKDVEVAKFATHEDYFLCTFTNPKNSAETLMGWIHKSGFAPSQKLTCPTGQVKFSNGCKFDCSNTKKCPAGMECTGLGARPEINDGAFQFCEAAGLADAGAPAPKPAADAGAPKPQPRPTNCPAGQTGWDDGKCHPLCTSNKDCKTGSCTPINATGTSICL